MKIKLNDNTELNVIQVNGSSRYFQGQNRDSLEFVFKKGEYAFEELDRLFADKDKAGRVTVIDNSLPDSPQESVYTDYSLRVSMEQKPVTLSPATPDSPEETEERVMVTMAQLSYLEKQQAILQAQMDGLLAAMANK